MKVDGKIMSAGYWQGGRYDIWEGDLGFWFDSFSTLWFLHPEKSRHITSLYDYSGSNVDPLLILRMKRLSHCLCAVCSSILLFSIAMLPATQLCNLPGYLEWRSTTVPAQLCGREHRSTKEKE